MLKLRYIIHIIPAALQNRRKWDEEEPYVSAYFGTGSGEPDFDRNTYNNNPACQIKETNELVNKVCSAIDLELESGDGTESASIPMDQVETYKIEDAMTINLKTGADGWNSLCKAYSTISMDSKNDGYKTYGEDMAERETILKDTINSVINILYNGWI